MLFLDTLECRKNLRVHRYKNNLGVLHRRYVYLPNPNKENFGYIYNPFGLGFPEKPSTLPTIFKFVKPTKRDLANMAKICERYNKTKIMKIKKKGGVSYEKWINKSEKYWMTEKKFKALCPNVKYKFLLLDKTVSDIVLSSENIIPWRLYNPVKFFRLNSIHILRTDYDMFYIKYDDIDDEFRNPIKLNDFEGSL